MSEQRLNCHSELDLSGGPFPFTYPPGSMLFCYDRGDQKTSQQKLIINLCDWEIIQLDGPFFFRSVFGAKYST